MRVSFLPLTLAAVTTSLLAATTTIAATPAISGWFPCSSSTFQDSAPAEEEPAAGSTEGESSQIAQCATFKAPLCYTGVCTSTANTTVDIFVKRIAAVADGKPNIFFMQGGPGAASPAMESAMTGVYALLKGNVNVYTMDHRGTGRSTKLDCVAAQAQTSGSPSGSSIDASEVGSCAADLEAKYGSDLASFSVTSAASDLNLFISSFLANQQTFVYGVSYGTSLVERLIHLNTTGVAGYILDGISTTSGSDLKNFEYFSSWDRDYDEVGQYFLAACAANQEDCGKYFPGTTVHAALKALMTNLDSSTYKCSATADELLASVFGYEAGVYSPAESLRSFMGSLLADSTLRTFIPVLTYRLTRCNSDDINVLTHFFETYAEYMNGPGSEDGGFDSDLVYKIIVYSEFWESPAPSTEVMTARFMNTTMSSGSFSEVQTYCAFTKDPVAACAEYNKFASYNASPISYKKDQYWNKAAKPPSDASVLVMSSKMDPQTPHKYAEFLFDAIDTKNKQLITFDAATHGTLWTTPVSNDDPDAMICGMAVVASYVAVGGDFAKMDKSCVAKMPAVSFKVPAYLTQNWLNATSAVDGAFVGESNDGGNDDGNKFKALFFVFLALFVFALLAAVVLLVKWRSANKKARDAAPVEPVYIQTQS